MYNKDNKKSLNGKDIVDSNQHPTINFNPKTAIAVEEALLNSYGLDLTDPNNPKYNHHNIVVEVTGGIKDIVLTHLKVSLKIYQKGNISPTAIKRCQQVDLFNDHQVETLIRDTSERIKIESIKVREVLYSLAEKLEQYRLDKTIQSETSKVSSRISASATKEIKNYLKQTDLLTALTKTIQAAGVPEGELGLKLLLLTLSRKTAKPIHTIIQGNLFISHEVVKAFKTIIPEEQLRDTTSVSNTALSYPPYQDYWKDKTLVIDRLEASLGRNSLVEEYINSGQVQRIVTEDNHKTGLRTSREQSNQNTFGILSYTHQDYLPIFNAPNVLCLPMGDLQQLKNKLYDLEILQNAGMIDEEQQYLNIQLLVNIQRSLQPLKVKNSYFEQVDFQPFFKNDLKQIRLFLQLTNLVALLHQEQLPKTKENNQLCIEVQPQHMVTVLELFKDVWLTKDEELYFAVMGTFNKLKTVLKKEFKSDYQHQEFFTKDYWKKVGMSPSTFAKHIKQLDTYGKLKRVGGNNRTGYKYQVAEWEEENNNTVLYDQLLNKLKEL